MQIYSNLGLKPLNHIPNSRETYLDLIFETKTDDSLVLKPETRELLHPNSHHHKAARLAITDCNLKQMPPEKHSTCIETISKNQESIC